MLMSETRPVGRPPITLNDLEDGWEKGVMELAEVGASEVEVRGYLGISKTVWYRLMEENEEFKETMANCSQACQIWWEKHGRLNLENKEFNTRLWDINMKNRFHKDGWADKKDIDITTKGDKLQSISPHQFVGEDE